MNTPKLSPLSRCILRRSEQGQTALIPFVTAGIPSPEAFWDTLAELADKGADIIEIGVPFSDPVADGPVVAKAGEEALQKGIDLAYIMQGLAQHRHRLGECGLVLMGYANPFLQYGWPLEQEQDRLHGVEAATRASLSTLARDLAKAGVQGIIIPDLPLDESGPWQEALAEQRIDLIPLVGVNTPLERMQACARKASGYVYVVSVLGTTGVRSAFPPELAHTLARARAAFALPLALGFGLEHPRQLEAIPREARPEAFVFGSALIRHLQSGQSADMFMMPWNEARKG